MNHVVEVRQLRKTFRPGPWQRRVEALRGITFHVEPGSCFGCLGQNGAGKTTTIKVATGQLRPTQGNVYLFGKPGSDPSVRQRLGYLPENPYFHEHLSPVEGMELFGRLSGLTRMEARKRAPALLERVGLAEASKRRLKEFSKGMRQRFGLAAALIARPPLLLLDEPLSGLDPAGRKLLKNIILEQNRDGVSVFLSSHVLADVEEICDHVVVLHQGKLVRQGAISELLDGEVREFEIQARQVPEALHREIEAAAGAFYETGGAIRAAIPGATLGPEFAAKIVAQGGTLIALVPERETLESWFVRLTSAEDSKIKHARSEVLV